MTMTAAKPGSVEAPSTATNENSDAFPGQRRREVSDRWLPPLTALKTFEAVGRVGMHGAALELNVTPAALSHQIRALETDLGVKLFTRTRNGLILNKSGNDYLEDIASSFDLLYSATRRVKNPLRTHRLVIECLTSFENDFIIPRLRTFYENNRDMELEFRSVPRPRARFDFAHTGAHVAITGGNVAGDFKGLNAEQLAHETFFPVCSPALQNGPNPLRRPSDLAKQTLLVVARAPEGWREWIAAAEEAGEDLGDVALANALRFDNFHSASLAAIQGVGVDLGRAPLVEYGLRSGQLIAPFDISVRSTASYWLVYPDIVGEMLPFSRFRDWLLNELHLAGSDL